MRKVVEGAASKSYGIQVAKMAGLPNEVINNAQEVLRKIEKERNKDLGKGKKVKDTVEVPQLSLTFD